MPTYYPVEHNLNYNTNTFVFNSCCTDWIPQCLFWIILGPLISFWVWMISFHTHPSMALLARNFCSAVGALNGFCCCPFYLIFYYINSLIISIYEDEFIVPLLATIFAVVCLFMLILGSATVIYYVEEFNSIYYIDTVGLRTIPIWPLFTGSIFCIVSPPLM